MAKFEILSEGVIVDTARSKDIPYTAYKNNNLYCPTYSEVTSSKYFTDPNTYRLTVEKPEGMGSYKDNELIWNLGFDTMLKKRTVEYKEEHTDGNEAPASGGESCGHVKATKIEKLDNVVNSLVVLLDLDLCKTWSENVSSARSEVKSAEYTKEDGTKGTVSCTLKQAAGTSSTVYNITITPISSSLTAEGGSIDYTVVSTKVVTTNGESVITYTNATITATGGELSVDSVSGENGTFTLTVPKNSGNITVTATNSGDTTKKATATVTVAAKAISKIESNNDTTLSYTTIAKAGGTASPIVSATFKVTYTDGTSENVNADSYSYSSTYASINATTGVVTKSSANEETTQIKVCDVTVTPSYIGTNGKTASSPVYLAAGDLITYTAIWDANGGQFSDGNISKQTTVTKGTVAVAPEEPTKNADADGSYTFAGWSPEPSVIDEDTTYTAQWTLNTPTEVKFTFDLNGGYVIDFDQPEKPRLLSVSLSGMSGDTVILPSYDNPHPIPGVENQPVVPLKSPTGPSYYNRYYQTYEYASFKGWTTDSSVLNQIYSEIDDVINTFDYLTEPFTYGSTDITVYAVWTKNRYADDAPEGGESGGESGAVAYIRWHSNEGHFIKESLSDLYISEVPLGDNVLVCSNRVSSPAPRPELVERSGYTFKEWNTQSDGNGTTLDPDSTTVTVERGEDLSTVNAKFTPPEYSDWYAIWELNN